MGISLGSKLVFLHAKGGSRLDEKSRVNTSHNISRVGVGKYYKIHSGEVVGLGKARF